MLAFVEGTPSAQYMKEWAEAAVRMSQDSATIEAGRLVFDLERQELLSGKALPARVVQWLQDVRRKEQ